MKTNFFFIIVILLLGFSTTAQVRLPKLVGDSMVLQRNQKVNIWGWASPGEDITITFNNKKYRTTAAENKMWSVTLPAMKEGGPYNMVIKGRNEIVIRDILIGDVWLCSGQSNMAFQINSIKDKYAADVAASGNYQIRHFLVHKKYSYTPLYDVEGRWKAANPANIGEFTAVGYFFAKSLYDKYKVPIGLIHASWAGTPAEAWTSLEGLKNFPEDIAKTLYLKDTAIANSIIKKDNKIVAAWYKEIRNRDQGFLTKKGNWADPSIIASAWKTVLFPDFWDFQKDGPGNIDGVVWFRKEVNIPASMLKKEVYVELGLIDDIDTTYFNGKKIGFSNNKYMMRKYKVPASLLKEGINLITVRIIDNEGMGGFIKDKPFRLTAGNESISLSGKWQYKVGAVMEPMPVNSFTRLFYQPSVLYDGMINPVKPFTIKGVIWYQGEDNAWNPQKYKKLLPNMIADWRTKWNLGDFPFLIVQLANFMSIKDQPGSSNWALLREAQSTTAATTLNCGLAVTIDIGEANDVHPQNKKEVGFRLALAAEKVAYGEKNIVYSGPEMNSMKIREGNIILSFKNVGTGLLSKGSNQLNQFAIAGTDRKFVWASAKIVGDKVIVWNNRIINPVAVRYAWADNPEGCNLYNKEGLPASPFRSDNWK